MECEYCHDKLTPFQFVQVNEVKQGKETGRVHRLCTTCYKKYFNLEVKELPIKTDIKAELERWRKEHPTLN
jgi:transcriptional regulator NrdR family protein